MFEILIKDRTSTKAAVEAPPLSPQKDDFCTATVLILFEALSLKTLQHSPSRCSSCWAEARVLLCQQRKETETID